MLTATYLTTSIYKLYITVLHLSFIPVNFSESNAQDFRLVITGISVNVPATSEDFWQLNELPNDAENVRRCSKDLRALQNYLKADNFSALWSS